MKIGVITVSDSSSRGERESLSDKVIVEMMQPLGEIASQVIIPDEIEAISTEIKNMADELKLDIILTTGGTGMSPRDVTPEATLKVVDKLVPGIPEAMRFVTYRFTPKAMLSRAIAGIRGKSLVINLPGSVKAVRECLEAILPVLEHAVEIMKGDVSRCGG